MADLETASQQLTGAANTLNQTSGDQLQTVSEQLGQAAEVSTESQMEVTERLEETLGRIQDIRTQDLSARLTVAGGMVEDVEAPVADVAQLETFTAQMEAYVSRVANIQNMFAENQTERVEAAGKYNETLSETAERLESGTEQLTVQSEKAKELRETMSEVGSGDFGGMVQTGGGGSGGSGMFERWAMGAEGLSGTMHVNKKRMRQTRQESEGAAAGMEHATGATKGFSTSLMTAVNVISTGIAVAVAGVVERFLDLNEQVQNFIDETGISAERAEQMRSQLALMTPQLRRAGLEISDMVEAQTVMTEEFGSFQNAAQQIGSTFGGIKDPAKALRTEITQVAGRLRLSGQEAAEMITSFQELSATTGMSRQNLQRSAKAAAETAKVAPKAVMQDIAENSEQLASFSGMSGEELAAAAAHARNLGTNIGSIAETTEQIVTDIPGFVQGLEKARSLSPQLGINAQQLTRAAAQSPKEFQKELSAQLQNVNFEDLGVFARQRLEDAIPGQTIADMQRMAESARRAEMSQAELTEAVSQGKAPMTELFDVTESQTALTQLQNELNALVGTISVALEPTFNRMESVLTTVLQHVASFVDWARQGVNTFQKWADTLGPAGQSIRGVVEALAGVGGVAAAWQTLSAALGTVGFQLSGVVGTASSLASWIGSGGLAAAAASAASTIGTVAAAVAVAASALIFFREPLMDAVMGFKQGLMPALEPIGAQFDRLLTVLAPVGDMLMDVFDFIMAGSGEISWVAPLYRTIGDVIGTVVANAFRSLVSAVEITIEAFGFLKNTVQFIWDIISLDFDGAVRNWGEAFDSFSNIVSVVADTLIANMANMIGAIFGVDAGAIESALDAVFVDPIRSIGDSIESLFKSIPKKIPMWLQGAGKAIGDALNPTTGTLEKTVSNAAGTVMSYLPSSPAEKGPLSNLGKVDMGGAMAETIQPEPVQQQMESTMGQATQAATEGVRAQQMEQANKVQVDAATGGGGGGGADLPDGIIPLLQKISQNEKQILAALQNLDVDAYLDSKKVTDKLRKENNKNTMKTV